MPIRLVAQSRLSPEQWQNDGWQNHKILMILPPMILPIFFVKQPQKQPQKHRTNEAAIVWCPGFRESFAAKGIVRLRPNATSMPL